jgi:hypothetical protein
MVSSVAQERMPAQSELTLHAGLIEKLDQEQPQARSLMRRAKRYNNFYYGQKKTGKLHNYFSILNQTRKKLCCIPSVPPIKDFMKQKIKFGPNYLVL